MSFELVYTSAAKGLKASSSGFCTVAATAGISKLVMMKLEGLSAYDFCYNLSDPNASLNPPNFAHTTVQIGARQHAALSRVGFAGSDYSGRANKIAHHFLLGNEERLPSGPAEMMVAMDNGVFCHEWKDEPAELPGRSLAQSLPIGQTTVGPANHWQRVAGDAGWAGVLAKAFRDNPTTPAYVIFTPGVDILRLFQESLAILPLSQRWDVTFSTYYTSMPAGCFYNWRAAVAGTAAAREPARFPNAIVIDLTASLGQAPENECTEAARAGRTLAEPALAPTGASPAGAVDIDDADDIDDIYSLVPLEEPYGANRSGSIADSRYLQGRAGPAARNAQRSALAAERRRRKILWVCSSVLVGILLLAGMVVSVVLMSETGPSVGDGGAPSESKPASRPGGGRREPVVQIEPLEKALKTAAEHARTARSKRTDVEKLKRTTSKDPRSLEEAIALVKKIESRVQGMAVAVNKLEQSATQVREEADKAIRSIDRDKKADQSLRSRISKIHKEASNLEGKARDHKAVLDKLQTDAERKVTDWINRSLSEISKALDNAKECLSKASKSRTENGRALSLIENHRSLAIWAVTEKVERIRTRIKEAEQATAEAQSIAAEPGSDVKRGLAEIKATESTHTALRERLRSLLQDIEATEQKSQTAKNNFAAHAKKVESKIAEILRRQIEKPRREFLGDEARWQRRPVEPNRTSEGTHEVLRFKVPGAVSLVPTPKSIREFVKLAINETSITCASIEVKMVVSDAGRATDVMECQLDIPNGVLTVRCHKTKIETASEVVAIEVAARVQGKCVLYQCSTKKAAMKGVLRIGISERGEVRVLQEASKTFTYPWQWHKAVFLPTDSRFSVSEASQTQVPPRSNPNAAFGLKGPRKYSSRDKSVVFEFTCFVITTCPSCGFIYEHPRGRGPMECRKGIHGEKRISLRDSLKKPTTIRLRLLKPGLADVRKKAESWCSEFRDFREELREAENTLRKLRGDAKDKDRRRRNKDAIKKKEEAIKSIKKDIDKLMKSDNRKRSVLDCCRRVTSACREVGSIKIVDAWGREVGHFTVEFTPPLEGERLIHTIGRR